MIERKSVWEGAYEAPPVVALRIHEIHWVTLEAAKPLGFFLAANQLYRARPQHLPSDIGPSITYLRAH